MAKRTFDILFSSIAIAVLWPVMLVVAIAVLAGSGRPILYRGWRAGLGGQPFRILKFRTMVVNAECLGGSETAADDARITRVGSVLRRYKLDELPQLFNILPGAMSVVGPRPEVMQEVQAYGKRELALLSIRPGLTDWASIRFRHEEDLLRGAKDPKRVYHDTIQPEKFRLGLEYLEQRSMLVDLGIIVSTVRAIFK